MIRCAWKEYWGFDCLTCGFQRSFLQLLEGNFIESFQTFPATIPLLFTFVFAGLHIWKRYQNGGRIIVTSFSLSAALIVGNYLTKMYFGTIFH